MGKSRARASPNPPESLRLARGILTFLAPRAPQVRQKRRALVAIFGTSGKISLLRGALGGQWVPCTVCGYDAVHGLHELRDASGAVTPWIDLCAERWVYAHYFLGEDRFSQLAWMV